VLLAPARAAILIDGVRFSYDVSRALRSSFVRDALIHAPQAAGAVDES
jgi:hypothetical protein